MLLLKLMKAILKNIDKFNNIKLAKGIYLDNVATTSRNGDCGVSTCSFGENWYILPKGKALFKSFDGKFARIIRKNRIINELLCNELCDQVGILHATMEPATIKKITGLVSYNVVKSHEKLLTGYSLCKMIQNTYVQNNLENYGYTFDELIDRGYNIDKKTIIQDMFKICIFDLLTLQTDRHMYNTFFIKNRKTKQLTLAPLLDNEFAFAGKLLQEILEEKNFDIDFEQELNYLYINDFHWIISEASSTRIKLKDIVGQYVKLCKCDKNFGCILKDMIKNFDIKTAVNNVMQKGYKISQEYCMYLYAVTDYIKNMILSEYRNIKTTDKKKTKLENYEMLY